MRVWVKFEDDVLHPAVKGPTYQLMLRQAFARMPRDLVEERIELAPTPQKAAMLRQAPRAASQIAQPWRLRDKRSPVPSTGSKRAARQPLVRRVCVLSRRYRDGALVDRLEHLNLRSVVGKPRWRTGSAASRSVRATGRAASA
jgi:hypothetical protein